MDKELAERMIELAKHHLNFTNDRIEAGIILDKAEIARHDEEYYEAAKLARRSLEVSTSTLAADRMFHTMVALLAKQEAKFAKVKTDMSSDITVLPTGQVIRSKTDWFVSWNDYLDFLGNLWVYA